MPDFSIYRHATGDYKAIKSGARMEALFFGPFWAAYIRLWWLVAVWFGAAAVSLYISGEEFNILDVGILILGLVAIFKGEDWETARFEKGGYVHVGDVASAHNSGHAVSVFLTRNEDTACPVPDAQPGTRTVPRQPLPPAPEPAPPQPTSGLVERAKAFRELREAGVEEAEAKRLAGLE
ncbi:MAG: hypothetical protein OXC11_14805 [Rhodospirillales bacterium]|nr:hypothetical protein [Rhodospirillales bacterium]